MFTLRAIETESLSPPFITLQRRERERDTLSSLHRRSLSPLYIEKRDTLSYLSRKSLSHRDRDERHVVPSIEKEYVSYLSRRARKDLLSNEKDCKGNSMAQSLIKRRESPSTL